jgi:hypothetical protein
MQIIGIDPGATGAIAVLDINGTIQDIYDMPSSKVVQAEIISRFSSDDRACIETPYTNTHGDADKELAKLVRKLPLLENYNQLIGMLVANKVPVSEVNPRSWQAVFNVKGKTSTTDSINQCLLVFPGIEDKLFSGRKRLHGRSDALLIAEWKRLQIVEQSKRVA